MQTVIQDVRFAIRMLIKRPGFTVAAVAVLALGIGANSAIFSMVDAILLRSLPYPDPNRLVMLFEGMPKAVPDPIPFSAPDYRAFEERAQSFEALAAFQNKEYELSGVDRPERLTGARVSASLFSVLGVQPMPGRAFTAEEDRKRADVVVLSHGLWLRHFGGDPDIIGQSIQIDRRPYTVVGVTPRSFVFPNRGPVYNNRPADLYVPISFTAFELQSFGSMYNNSVIARLKPTTSLGEAAREVASLAKYISKELYPAASRPELTASVTPYRDEVVGRVKTLLLVLLGAVAVVS